MAVPQVYGLAKPAAFTAAARKFPRSLPAGFFLMGIATLWFLWLVKQEPIADFAAFKPHMMAIFAGIGVATCFFVQDFLAVRGLAVVLMLVRSEERRVGKECLRLCRSRWSPYH